MDKELEERWRWTVGEDVDLATLSTQATYRRRMSPISGSSLFPSPEQGIDGELAGGFLLLDEIGRGGMGVVLRARQNRLDRDVAIKTTRKDASGGSDRSSASRGFFVAEAMVTGSLQHPNIVPVHDLGETTDGDLYLAMKLVDGEAWEAALKDDRRHDLDFHLGVLDQVCNALAFAHSRGVVHNDLKPSNVMLGRFGEVLLMDWGVAVTFFEKGKAPWLTHRSQVTGPCGTPSYMPPELARGQGDRIGPTTDVYLLGANLYRLLAGRPPHAGRGFVQVVAAASEGRLPLLGAQVPSELRRICLKALAIDPRDRHQSAGAFQSDLRGYLRTRESRAISSRAGESLEEACCKLREGVTGDGERGEVYDGFATSLAGFEHARHLWPENPEAIAGQAKARRQYAATALALGDLGLAESQAHHLPPEEADPIANAVASRRKKRKRQERVRNRLVASLVILVLAVISGLLYGIRELEGKNQTIAEEKRTVLLQKTDLLQTNQTILERNVELAAQKKRTETALAVASQRGEIAQNALDVLAFRVQRSLSDRLGDEEANTLAKMVLQTAKSGWEAMLKTDMEHGAVTRKTALTRLELARVLLSADGDVAGATREIEAARVELDGLAAENPDDPLVSGAMAEVLLDQARLEDRKGKLAKAADLAGRSLRILRSLSSSDSSLAILNVRADAAELLGELRLDQGRGGDADAAISEAVSIRRELQRSFPRDHQVLAGLATTLESLASRHLEQGQFKEALEIDLEMIAIFRHLSDGAKGSLSRRNLAVTLIRAGNSLQELGRYRDAQDCYEEAVKIREGFLRLHPTNFSYIKDLGFSLAKLGRILKLTGDRAGAKAAFERAAATRLSLEELSPSDRLARRELSSSLIDLGGIAEEQGNSSEAEANYRRAVDIRRALVLLDSTDVGARRDLGIALAMLSQTLKKRGAWKEAEQLAREWLASTRARAALQPESIQASRDVIASAVNLLNLLTFRERWAAMEAPCIEALQIAEKIVSSGQPSPLDFGNLAGLHHSAGNFLTQTGRSDEAEERFRQAIELSETLHDNDPEAASPHRQLSISQAALAKLLASRGRRAEADSLTVLSISHSRALASAETPGSQPHFDLALTLLQRGMRLTEDQRWQEAESSLEESVRLFSELVALDSSNVDSRENLADSLYRLGELFFRTGRSELGRANFIRCAEILRELDRKFRDARHSRGKLAGVLANLGELAMAERKLVEADSLFCEALALDRERHRLDPDNFEAGRDLVTLLASLAQLRTRQARMDEAIGLRGEALGALDRIEKKNPARQRHIARNRAVILEHIAIDLVRLGSVEEAQGQLEAAREIRETIAQTNPEDFKNLRGLAINYRATGQSFLSSGDLTGALVWYRRSLDAYLALVEKIPALEGELELIQGEFDQIEAAVER